MQSLPFDMIELNRSFKTKEEAIRYCGQMLVEAGCVDEEYIDAMVDRDKMLSVYMGNFIAIPHGTDEAKKYVKKIRHLCRSSTRWCRFWYRRRRKDCDCFVRYCRSRR